MATYGITMAGAVSATATDSGGPAETVYTAPAGTYAILNMSYVSTGGSNTITIGGQTFGVFAASTGTQWTGIYLGPGQSIVISFGGTAMTVSVSGVSFYA